jgi:hypothetical protein
MSSSATRLQKRPGRRDWTWFLISIQAIFAGWFCPPLPRAPMRELPPLGAGKSRLAHKSIDIERSGRSCASSLAPPSRYSTLKRFIQAGATPCA